MHRLDHGGIISDKRQNVCPILIFNVSMRKFVDIKLKVIEEVDLNFEVLKKFEI